MAHYLHYEKYERNKMLPQSISPTNSVFSDESTHALIAGFRPPVLKVIGLGGGGCNAVERMIELGLTGVDFIVANTDKQALATYTAPTKIQLGPNITRGLGAGGDSRIGQLAAEESADELAAAMTGADMVFLTAGMGGGTGTGSIPVTAEIARRVGAVSIAIVTTPFSFEMGRRQRNAAEGLTRLRGRTHTLIAIPNDRLLFVAPRNLPMETAFRLADDVLRQAVQGITELITEPGMINVDFAHIRRLIQLGGGALMTIGQGSGENKTSQALEQALHHPLLDSVSLESAQGIIANFTGGNHLTLSEVQEALNHLQAETGGETEIVMGVINDERMGDRVQIILVITGLGAPTLEDTLSNFNKVKPESDIQTSTKPPTGSGAAQNNPKQHTPFPGSYSEPAIPCQPLEPSFVAQSLDLPAFLRRRTRPEVIPAAEAPNRNDRG
jgi:cell division protein FtsZ